MQRGIYIHIYFIYVSARFSDNTEYLNLIMILIFKGFVKSEPDLDFQRFCEH